MTPEQQTAFKAATAGLATPELTSKLFIGLVIVVVIMWFARGLVTVYKGYASGNLDEKTLVSFVIRGIILILITIYLFAS